MLTHFLSSWQVYCVKALNFSAESFKNVNFLGHGIGGGRVTPYPIGPLDNLTELSAYPSTQQGIADGCGMYYLSSFLSCATP